MDGRGVELRDIAFHGRVSCISTTCSFTERHCSGAFWCWGMSETTCYYNDELLLLLKVFRLDELCRLT
jgi:hypothetical protein